MAPPYWVVAMDWHYPNQEPITACPGTGGVYHLLSCGHIVVAESPEPCGSNCLGCSSTITPFTCHECISHEATKYHWQLVDEVLKRWQETTPEQLGALDEAYRLAEERQENLKSSSNGRPCNEISRYDLRRKDPIDFDQVFDEDEQRQAARQSTEDTVDKLAHLSMTEKREGHEEVKIDHKPKSYGLAGKLENMKLKD